MITPPGEGGIAAIRLAGAGSLAILDRHFRAFHNDNPRPFLLRYGTFHSETQEPIDDVTAVYMPERQSYTGLEQVEIFCHGGRMVVQKILEQLLESGARAAEPGEFTKLAFLTGRIDLSRAEAVAEIISANTAVSFDAARRHLLGNYTEYIEQLRQKIISVIAEVEASIDFPEEQIDLQTIEGQRILIADTRKSIGELADTYTGGRIIREGFKVAIAGRPNAGKSSLFNHLLRQERALVTPTPGTTRDYLSEWIDLHGYAVNLIDTAGIREGGGKIERAGQDSARKIMQDADLVLWLVDVSGKGWGAQAAEDIAGLGTSHVLIGGNKIDLVEPGKLADSKMGDHEIAYFSCKTGEGIDSLLARLRGIIETGMPDMTSGLVVTSARHCQKLGDAARYLQEAEEKLVLGESPEICAFCLRQASSALEEITGKIYNEDILGEIFSKFCIGK